MSLYTRTGDDGSTFCARLGRRVPKDHPLIEFVGSLDEAVSLVGLARSLLPPWMGEAAGDLAVIQDILFNVGLDVSSGGGRVGDGHVKWLEEVTDKYYGREPLRSFILPSGPPPAAALHAARAAVRRAERRLVAAARALGEEGLLSTPAYRALNRASDALFALAVYVSRRMGYGDEPVGSYLGRVG